MGGESSSSSARWSSRPNHGLNLRSRTHNPAHHDNVGTRRLQPRRKSACQNRLGGSSEGGRMVHNTMREDSGYPRGYQGYSHSYFFDGSDEEEEEKWSEEKVNDEKREEENPSVFQGAMELNQSLDGLPESLKPYLTNDFAFNPEELRHSLSSHYKARRMITEERESLLRERNTLMRSIRDTSRNLLEHIRDLETRIDLHREMSILTPILGTLEEPQMIQQRTSSLKTTLGDCHTLAKQSLEMYTDWEDHTLPRDTGSDSTSFRDYNIDWTFESRFYPSSSPSNTTIIRQVEGFEEYMDVLWILYGPELEGTTFTPVLEHTPLRELYTSPNLHYNINPKERESRIKNLFKIVRRISHTLAYRWKKFKRNLKALQKYHSSLGYRLMRSQVPLQFTRLGPRQSEIWKKTKGRSKRWRSILLSVARRDSMNTLASIQPSCGLKISPKVSMLRPKRSIVWPGQLLRTRFVKKKNGRHGLSQSYFEYYDDCYNDYHDGYHDHFYYKYKYNSKNEYFHYHYDDYYNYTFIYLFLALLFNEITSESEPHEPVILGLSQYEMIFVRDEEHYRVFHLKQVAEAEVCEVRRYRFSGLPQKYRKYRKRSWQRTCKNKDFLFSISRHDYDYAILKKQINPTAFIPDPPLQRVPTLAEFPPLSPSSSILGQESYIQTATFNISTSTPKARVFTYAEVSALNFPTTIMADPNYPTELNENTEKSSEKREKRRLKQLARRRTYRVRKRRLGQAETATETS